MIDEKTDIEQFEEYTEGSITKGLFIWLRSIPFYIGLLKGLHLYKDSDDGEIFIHDTYPPHDYKKYTYGWLHYYGNLYVYLDICNRESPGYLTSYTLGRDWNYLNVTIDDKRFYSREYLLYMYTKIDNTIHKFLTGIVQKDGYRPCSLCAGPDSVRYFDFCTPIGDKWLCKDCMNRYSLPSPIEFEERIRQTREKSFTEEQRAKMTPALRYSILERDEFRCKICGRSPRQGDDIKLEVDHIKPIFKGGLTEIDNLWTLCQDCNRGKGVKTYWTDPVPQKQEIVKGNWFGDQL